LTIIARKQAQINKGHELKHLDTENHHQEFKELGELDQYLDTDTPPSFNLGTLIFPKDTDTP